MSPLSICPYCRTKNIRKYGFRKTLERGKVHKFQCLSCKRIFSENKGYKHKHKSEQTIVDAISLYATGLTLREEAEFLHLSRNTILRWVHEYSILLQKFLMKKIPTFSSKLHLDELFLHMKGTFYYVWDAICAETKFACGFLSQTRRLEDADMLLGISPSPIKLVSDGAFAYITPILRRFGRQWANENYHRCADFEDKKNNNMVERLQNTLRRWLHPKRGFYSLRTGNIMLNFELVFYNFVRVHTTIKCTPAEKAGVFVYPTWIKDQKQRWRYLIERASFLLDLFFRERSTVNEDGA